MTHTLGIDIGTFESKGVLVDSAGQIVATASRPHKMIVPRAGWAEHRADEDWWGDFVHLTARFLPNPASTRPASRPSPPAPSAPACCPWT
jgi:xylulokinase